MLVDDPCDLELFWLVRLRFLSFSRSCRCNSFVTYLFISRLGIETESLPVAVLSRRPGEGGGMLDEDEEVDGDGALEGEESLEAGVACKGLKTYSSLIYYLLLFFFLCFQLIVEFV